MLRVVLDNPARHNSLSADMLAGLQRVLRDASDDNGVRAVLIRGRGERAFASGADIGEQSQRAASGTTNPDRGDYMAILQRCTKPVVAMIHGYCIGGGLMVAMAADIRIAAHDAVFGVPAANLGVAYPLSAVHVLVDLVGRGWASDLCLSGERIDAETAAAIGLVTRIHPKGELEDRTEALLDTLVSRAPLSAIASKASVIHAVSASRAPTDDVVSLIDAVWRSHDAGEGMAAFFEKRAPNWLGR